MKYMFIDLIKTLCSSLPQGLLIALCTAFLFVFIHEKNVKSAVSLYIRDLRHSRAFRCKIYFFTYLYIMLYRAVLSRESTYEPLSKILDGWRIYIRGYTGLNYEDAFGNILVFVPFTLLLLFFAHGSKYKKRKSDILLKPTFFAFLLSLFIEINQLIFRKGTFQISDLVLNTIGGLIGAILYIIITKITDKTDRRT